MCQLTNTRNKLFIMIGEKIGILVTMLVLVRSQVSVKDGRDSQK